MNKNPKVSILIPVYNRENLIKETLDSAINQTYNDYEIVVVDNKSTDNTFKVISEIARSNNKIKIFQNETNLGPVGNWKKCLEYARGEYVKILWSDDLISNDFLEKAVPILEENEDVGFVYSKVKIISDNSSSIVYDLNGNGKYFTKKYISATLKNIYKYPVSPGCALFRKKDVTIYKNIPNKFGIKHNKTGAGIDLLIFLEAASNYKYMWYIDEELSFFRSHNDSITVNNDLFREYMTAKTFFIKKHGLTQSVHIINSHIILKEIFIYKNFNKSRFLSAYYNCKEKEYLKINYFHVLYLFFIKVFNNVLKKLGESS